MSPICRGQKELMPLQAADLIAWPIRRAAISPNDPRMTNPIPRFRVPFGCDIIEHEHLVKPGNESGTFCNADAGLGTRPWE